MDELSPTGTKHPCPESPNPHKCNLCDSIVLTHGKRAIVDQADRKRVGLRGWKAKKSRGGWYAYKPVVVHGHTHYIYMHRLIANTPPGQICHHDNENTLYNRRKNLQNITKSEHKNIHRIRQIAKRNNNSVDR